MVASQTWLLCLWLDRNNNHLYGKSDKWQEAAENRSLRQRRQRTRVLGFSGFLVKGDLQNWHSFLSCLTHSYGDPTTLIITICWSDHPGQHYQRETLHRSALDISPNAPCLQLMAHVPSYLTHTNHILGERDSSRLLWVCYWEWLLWPLAFCVWSFYLVPIVLPSYMINLAVLCQVEIMPYLFLCL